MSTDKSDSELDYTRLSRYLAGECTPAEQADVEEWLAGDPARRELLASLTTAWETAGRPRRHQTSNVDAAWTKMSAAMDRAEQPEVPVWNSPAWRIAAAILLLIVGSVGVWRWRAMPPDIAPTSYATGPGERQTIGIGDGTTVVLGPASRLTIEARYGRNDRNVSLEGEALFTVKHDPARTFRVRAAGAVVEDLGTEFAVRAYSPTDTVRVVVTLGVVQLRQATGTIVRGDRLRPGVIYAGQVGLLAPQGDAIVSPASNAAELIAWSTGQLVFDDTPMSRVAEELRRWYDVDVVVDSTLASRHVTAAFASDSLGEVARVIAATVGARVERDGRRVTFRAVGPAK